MHGWFHNDAFMENVSKPLFGAQFEWQHATSSAAAALAPLAAKLAVRHRHALLRVSLRQRSVDDGHHLGPVDDARRAASGRLCLLDVRRLVGAGRLGALYGLSTANVWTRRRSKPRAWSSKRNLSRRPPRSSSNSSKTHRTAPQRKRRRTNGPRPKPRSDRKSRSSSASRCPATGQPLHAATAGTRGICDGKTTSHDRRRRTGRPGGRDEAGRAGRRRRPDEPHAGQALAQRLRPGRHQQRQRPHAPAGRQRVEALRRHGLRRRFPAAPAAGQGNGRLGARGSST